MRRWVGKLKWSKMKQLNSEGNTDEKEGEKTSWDRGRSIVMVMYRGREEVKLDSEKGEGRELLWDKTWRESNTTQHSFSPSHHTLSHSTSPPFPPPPLSNLPHHTSPHSLPHPIPHLVTHPNPLPSPHTTPPYTPSLLTPRSMQPAIKSLIPVRVKNSYNPSAVGTAITSKRYVTISTEKLSSYCLSLFFFVNFAYDLRLFRPLYVMRYWCAILHRATLHYTTALNYPALHSI